VNLLLLAATALLLGAAPQSSPPVHPEIRGFVLEPETNQPVAGAEIALSVQESGPVLINGGWKLDDPAKATSDATGAFAISLQQPGSYRVQAKKSGYGPLVGGSRDYADAKLTKEAPAAEVRLFLGRFGAMSGSVIDDETGKPIPDLQIRASHARTQGMRFFPGDAVAGKTGADGQFVIAGLPPGDYAVEIFPQTGVDKRVLTEFTEKDAEKTDLDYEHTYWPGGHGPEAALPMTVAAGGTAYVGTLHAKKVPYYRVHVRIPVSNCEPGETMRVAEVIVTPGGGSLFTPPLAQTPCGKDVLITGYPRGAFRLLLNIDGRARENRGTASIPFVIADESIAITAPILPGVTVDGVVIAADGAKAPDFAKLTVYLRAGDGGGSPDDGMPTPDGDGKFRISYARPLSQTVMLQGLDKTHYLKEIRYNGVALSGDIIPLDEPAVTHALTLVVDDKVATISGSVSSGDGPVSNPIVIAMKWPWNGSALPVLARAQGDANGMFQMTGLAPGEYRVIAIQSIPQDLMSVTNAVMVRVMETAQKVELSAGGSQNVAVEPTVLTPQQLRP
jgi:uncharacterized protein (DUF2141 family)